MEIVSALIIIAVVAGLFFAAHRYEAANKQEWQFDEPGQMRRWRNGQWQYRPETEDEAEQRRSTMAW